MKVKVLGDISAELQQLAEATGGRIEEYRSSEWLGPFPQPSTYRLVLPSGERLDASAVLYSIRQSDPGLPIQSVLAPMVTTARALEESEGLQPWQTAPATTVYTPPPTTTTSTPAQRSEATSTAAGAVVYRPQVRLANLTRPSETNFRVGDRFRLEISGGQPNAAVVDIATHNGQVSTTRHGTTDAAGAWAIEGVMGADHVGTWTQQWTVGSVPATPELSFQVLPAEHQTVPQSQQAETTETGQSAGATLPSWIWPTAAAALLVLLVLFGRGR